MGMAVPRVNRIYRNVVGVAGMAIITAVVAFRLAVMMVMVGGAPGRANKQKTGKQYSFHDVPYFHLSDQCISAQLAHLTLRL